MGNLEIKALACVLCLWTLASVPVCRAGKGRDVLRHALPADTLQQRTSSKDIRRGHRMSTSAYPVRIETHGRVVMIHSDHVQLLPIYTRGGVLKMTLRLKKGTNWLSGLPRGNYFINNRPVAIK